MWALAVCNGLSCLNIVRRLNVGQCALASESVDDGRKPRNIFDKEGLRRLFVFFVMFLADVLCQLVTYRDKPVGQSVITVRIVVELCVVMGVEEDTSTPVECDPLRLSNKDVYLCNHFIKSEAEELHSMSPCTQSSKSMCGLSQPSRQWLRLTLNIEFDQVLLASYVKGDRLGSNQI